MEENGSRTTETSKRITTEVKKQLHEIIIVSDRPGAGIQKFSKIKLKKTDMQEINPLASKEMRTHQKQAGQS
ncbi:thymosin beta-4, Y-chromosomal-like [Cavia porcellus]|uniref:thymosin beta-4, Y-chromosomal-like n=1 Tax=Cavia porcellus TaxID=10141 RepID=UPI002FE3451D